MDSSNLIGNSIIAGSPGVFDAAPRRTLDQKDIALLSDVSSRLMKDPRAKKYPDVMSFAFWTRKGHLNALAESRTDLNSNIGRGLCFHIAPSNVPVNFAFSWAFSHLSGNVDIVRVPSKPFEQVQIICEAINASMEEAHDSRSAFITYSSDSEITATLSAIVDARVIWGGNKTVQSVRQMPSKPRCVDISFADRYSLSVIDCAAIASLDDDGLEALARDFYNDTYLMDQNACSSPMTIAWLNARGSEKERFWRAVRFYAQGEYHLQGAIVMDKYVQLCRDIIDGDNMDAVSFDSVTQVVPILLGDISDNDLQSYRGRGGYFYEIDIETLPSLFPKLDESCQTITYFGIKPAEIREAVLDSGVKGIDRIVPIGKAMDIDIVWDGMDLLSLLSRRVDAR